jgi:PII-like signaling protein
MVVVVDRSEHIEPFLAELRELVGDSLVVREPVDIVPRGLSRP